MKTNKLKIRNETFTEADMAIIVRYLHEKFIAVLYSNESLLADAAWDFTRNEAEADLETLQVREARKAKRRESVGYPDGSPSEKKPKRNGARLGAKAKGWK